MKAAKPDNIDAYIISFPENVQKDLEQIRLAIKELKRVIL